MKNNNKYLHISGIVKIIIVILAMLAIIGCKKSKNSQTSQTPVAVNVVKASQQTVPLTMNYIGSTKAISTVDIRARVEGFLIKRTFVEGSIVQKGDLLFEIDPQPFEIKLKKAKAQLIESMANAKFQKLELLRMAILYKKQVVAKEKYDQTAMTAKEAAGAVIQDQANVETAQVNLSYCTMYAPITGKIGQVKVNVGNYVGGGESTVLATIVKLDPIYVLFSPSVNDFGILIPYLEKNKSLPVKVTISDGDDYYFKGKLDFINNEADKSTSTVLLRAVISNPKRLLLPGINVNVNLILDKNAKALVIPQEAVMESQGVRYVYVLDNNNKVQQKTVVAKRVYKDQQVIDSGLNVGDAVVVTGQQKLKPGDTVTPTYITEQDAAKSETQRSFKDTSDSN